MIKAIAFDDDDNHACVATVILLRNINTQLEEAITKRLFTKKPARNMRVYFEEELEDIRKRDIRK